MLNHRPCSYHPGFTEYRGGVISLWCSESRTVFELSFLLVPKTIASLSIEVPAELTCWPE